MKYKMEVEEDVLSYPRWLLRIVASIRDSLRRVCIRFSLAWIPTTQFLVNEREPICLSFEHSAMPKTFLPSASRRILCNTFLIMTGLNTFSLRWSSVILFFQNITTNLKLSVGSSNANSCLVPHNLRCDLHEYRHDWYTHMKEFHTIVIASHCVGFTLPGMILLPGSFSGKLNSPRPHLGPEPRYLMSLAIFMSEQAMTFSAPWASTSASCAARASNYIHNVNWSVVLNV